MDEGSARGTTLYIDNMILAKRGGGVASEHVDGGQAEERNCPI